MKILYDHVGQTCNRLWALLPTIYKNLHSDSKIYVLFSDPEFHNFKNLCVCGNVHYIFDTYRINNSLIRNILNKVLSLLFYNLVSRKLYKIVNYIFPNNFINGWDTIGGFNAKINDVDISLLRKIYTPNESICKRCKSLFDIKHIDYDIIVGVHIRRGDYVSYLNGKYYYSFEDYFRCMRRVVDIFSQKRIAFFISTNDANFILPEDLNCFVCPNRMVVDDWYCLSICDYLIGPPSSFSRLASFIGGVPMYLIKKISDEIKSKDFAVNMNYLSE